MIETVSLFSILNKKLIELLRSLTEEEWSRPTIAKQWTVKDIAAHLLDTNIRTLARRDDHVLKPDRNINSYQDLVSYLNHLNAEWVSASKRISPQVLISLLETTGNEYAHFIATLNPHENAQFSVAWAGEHISKNWFDIAREYTEKWHHQQQIRDAVSKPGIMTRELFYPAIATFVCGLPHTYRNTTASADAVIKFIITTEIGGEWFLIYTGTGWNLIKDTQSNPVAIVTIPPDTAWKLFTKGITKEVALMEVDIIGDVQLGAVVLSLLAVMA